MPSQRKNPAASTVSRKAARSSRRFSRLFLIWQVRRIFKILYPLLRTQQLAFPAIAHAPQKFAALPDLQVLAVLDEVGVEPVEAVAREQGTPGQRDQVIGGRGVQGEAHAQGNDRCQGGRLVLALEPVVHRFIQFRVVAKFPRVDLFFRKQSVDLVFPGSLRSAGQGETAVKAVRADLAHAASWRETSEGPAAGGDGAGERVYAGGAGRERKMGTGHTGHLLSRKSCRWVGTAPGGGPLEYRFSKNKQKKSTAFQKLYSFTPMAQAPALFIPPGKGHNIPFPHSLHMTVLP